MENGNFVYYVVEQRQSHASPWLKPEGALTPVPVVDKWSICGSDYWGLSTNPRNYDFSPKNRKASEEWYLCYRQTGRHGWFTLRYAQAALRRLNRDDKGGIYDSFDTYKKRQQTLRHEFRIVKITQIFHQVMEPI